MLADLHLHTTESDGTWEPEQLVLEAAKRSLNIIAVTDHDTTAGIDRAIENAPVGLKVIPGIELSTVSENGEEVHILGLWIEHQNPELQEKLEILRQSRLQRIGKILSLLRKIGVDLSYGDVLKYAHRDVISRSHVASSLVEKGIVATKDEAFAEYLGQGALAYVERYKISPQEAIGLIHQAKGISVLAHPGLLKDLSILPSLAENGLIGIEVIHSSHSPSQEQYFLNLASQWNLLPSGGSDCHGPGGKDQLYMGDFTIPVSWVDNLASKRPL